MAKKIKMCSLEEMLETAIIPVEEQPYPLPENWSWVRFGYLSKDMADGPFGSNLKTEHYTQNKEVRIIQLSNIGEDGWKNSNVKYTTFEHAKTISRSIVKAGEIVIAKMMPAGRAMIVPNEEHEYVLSSDAVKFVPHNILNTKFILYGINSNTFNNQVLSETQGITRARTSIGKLKTYAFPFPPLEEQQRIVEQIDKLFIKLDEVKEIIDEITENCDNRKQAILVAAFKGKIVADASRWEYIELGKLTNIKSSKRIYAEEYKDDGVPFFRSTEVVELHDYRQTNPQIYISRERYEEIKEAFGVPQRGDLLVTSVGTIGKTWIVDDREFYYKDGNLTQVEQCDRLNMKYLQYYIESSMFKNQAIDTVGGSAYNALTIVKFNKIYIPVPPLEIQEQIINILDLLLNKEYMFNNIVDLKENIVLIKKSIIVKAFRGELATTDLSEPSSLELLKSILLEEK